MTRLPKPADAHERETERFRLAYQRLERAERRMRRAMLAWLRAKDAMQGLERRAGRSPAKIPGTYDVRDLAAPTRPRGG